MANSKDVDKILQNLKGKSSQNSTATVTSDRLSQIIAAETAKKNQTQPQTAAVNAVPKTVQSTKMESTHEIESEFFSKLATALKENPAVADLVEEVDEDLAEKSKNPVTVTAASYVDEKFVDFFTTSVAVPKAPSTTELLVKRRKGGFFRKKYITDSLTLSIPKEEVDKRQQKVAKPTTSELARDLISAAVSEVADKKDEQPKAEKKGLGLFKKKEETQPQQTDLPLYSREKVVQPAKSVFDETAVIDMEKKAQNAKAAAVAAEKQTADAKAQFLPEAVNDSAILYYDDGKAAPQQPAKAEEKPNDAESILKALKDKKTGTVRQATVVATADGAVETPVMLTQHTAIDTEEDTLELAEKQKSPFSFTDHVADFEDTIENTAYIPPQLAEEEKPQLEFVPKTEQDKKVGRITGDITQMFAAAGVLKDRLKGQPDEDAQDADEDAEEQVFDGDEETAEEADGIENQYITQQFSDDPAEILEELKNFKSTLAIRMGLSAVCTAVLLYLSFAASHHLPVPGFISPSAQPMLFYIANFVFYAIAVVGFLPTVANGITGFAKAPTQDSFVVIPAFWSLVQLLAAIFSGSNADAENTTLFAAFTVLAFGFNALGKYISANTILKNLSLAEVPEGINAGYIIKEMDDVKRLARSLEEKNPQILVSRRTGYISNFISGGFSTHKSEKYSRILAIATAVVTVICFGLGYSVTKSIAKGVFAAAGASVFMLPLSHSLISSVPGSLMQKALGKVGALVNGWQGIYQLSDATHVSFDAKHLFPKGCVVLHGIKTFEKERLDLAILYAASIAIEHVDNLRSVFMTVIDGKKDMLYEMDSCEYRVGQGYVAWIENNRVIMGNRSIMEEYNINLPPISMETTYISEGKKPIYLSVNGKLFGMFVVSYHADQAVKDNLLNLIESGKCVILQSNDFSIDSQLLELVYDLPADTVQVLNKNETALLLNYTAYSESTDSAMAHLDSLHSLSAGFFGADRANRAAATCSLIQIISIITGAVLSLVFTFSQTIWSIPLTSVLLLGFGWLGLSLMRAMATKYY